MSSNWKSAVDPRSGQTYFFHEITRETQWRKPTELATDEEKSAMEQKEQKEKDFFAAMEANILSSLSRGVIPGTPAQDRSAAVGRKEEGSVGKSERERDASGIESRYSLRKARSRAGRPNLVRTISTMDESVLTDVILRQPSFRSVKSGLSKNESLKLEDLRQFLGDSHIRDFDSMCSSSEGSQSSILETLEEDADESTCSIALDSIPNLRSNVPKEGNTMISNDDRNGSLRNQSRMLEQSISTRDDLNWEETQALNKLFSLTKEMIDADKERPNNTDDGSTTSDSSIDEEIECPTRTLRRVTEGDIGRTLPRELELEDSDSKKEKTTSQMIPRKVEAANSGKTAADTLRPGAKRRNRLLANSGKKAADILRPGVQRRNTCGTMYIRTTMSAPDKDATIRCVCGVYRSHIISSEHTSLSTEETDSLNVFNDYPDDAHEMQNQNPTLHEIATFYRDVFFKAQMEADCIIMSLIYVERLIKKTNGHLRPRATNWRSLLFSCMILSSKVWDDLSMWNADFSQSCPPGGVNFSLQRINQLELAILNTLKFNVKVPASEYAKYYFLLRSMLIKSGLGGEDLGSLNPLDVEGARKLQQVSFQFESTSLMKSTTYVASQRSKSMAVDSDQNAKCFRQPKTKVGLEQVVKM